MTRPRLQVPPFEQPLPPLPVLDLPEDPPSPSDPMFGMPGLPAWATEFRGPQWECITRIMDAYRQGARVVLLDAPTGSGKTLIGEVVRRLLKAPSVYVCSTKSLQDQIAKDFPYARVLKGRANYRTRNFPAAWPGISCADCSSAPGHPECPLCGERSACTYQREKLAAILAPLAVLNTAFYVGECNGPGTLAGRKFAIADEADTLEGILMGFVEVSISPRQQKLLQLEPPQRKTVESAWKDWVSERALPKVRRALVRIPDENPSAADLREKTILTRLAKRLARLERDLAEGTGRWVYDGYERGQVLFRPVRVDRLAPSLFFAHAPRHLLMTATMIEPAQMARDLGIPDGVWESVRMGSSFPAKRRPVYVAPVASMTHKNVAEAWPKMARACVAVARRHPRERILIHSVSYALTRVIVEELQYAGMSERVVTYTKAAGRDDALARYSARPRSVLVAPSLDRGIDLPGDLCRVQVVCKVPFLSLGDKQVSARLYGTGPDGQLWYTVQAIRTLVQMTGRGMRSAEDSCVTYLLDEQFLSSVWRRGKKLLPGWWKDSLDFGGRVVRELTEVAA